MMPPPSSAHRSRLRRRTSIATFRSRPVRRAGTTGSFPMGYVPGRVEPGREEGRPDLLPDPPVTHATFFAKQAAWLEGYNTRARGSNLGAGLRREQ